MLPNEPLEAIAQLTLLGLFRVGLFAAEGTLYLLKQISRFLVHTFTHLEAGLSNYTRICDYYLFGTPAIEVTAQPISADMKTTDIHSAIEGKQVMLLGASGDGKSTLAQYIAVTVGGQVRVYDCEGTPDGWRGLQVVGEGEDWESIKASMVDDLDNLSSQILLRKERGDAALVGSDRVIIAEEFPELNERIDIASDWLARHARRGRKTRRFIICLSQFDRVSAWGLEGKSDLEACFVKIRLGKLAVAHAKRLKNLPLEGWLRESRSHALADDSPLILPSYEELKRATVSFPMASLPATLPHREKPSEVPLSLDSADFSGDLEGIILALNAGKSADWVVKNVLGATGGEAYRKFKPVVAAIANSVGYKQEATKSS